MRDIYENFDSIPENKKVIIWGINQASGEIFCETLNRRIAVECFVDLTGEFREADGKKLFGKLVLTKEELLNSEFTRENAYILVEKREAGSEELKWLEEHYESAYIVCSVSDIDSTIKNAKNLYLYGAGSSGKRTCQILREQGIEINAFIDADSGKWNKKIEDASSDAFVYGPELIGENDVIIISSRYYPDIKKLLLKRGISEKNIFIDIRNSAEFSEEPIYYKNRVRLWFEYTKLYIIKGIEWWSFFWIVLMDFYEKKKIILYGVNEFTFQLIRLFELLEVQVAYCVDHVISQENLEMQGQNIKYREIYELAYEDMSDKIVYVVKVEEKEKGIENGDYTILEKLGLTFFKEIRIFDSSVFAIRNVRVEPDYGIKRDDLLDYTYIYKKSSYQYPGYIVLGDESKAKKRILILGGSTSDVGLYESFIKSWPEFLAEKMEDAVIFCGAVCAYDSKQELLKLLRDGKQIKPDTVISYSGFNDVSQTHTEGFPYLRKRLTDQMQKQEVFGIKTASTRAEEWIESENMMKIIANAYGAEFIGIFQPVLGNKINKSFNEKVIYAWSKELSWMQLNDFEDYQKETQELICKSPGLYDMTDLFQDETQEMFRDVCHLKEAGNRFLANAVYRLLEGVI